MELTENKYTTKEGKPAVSYSFSMKNDLPLQKPVEFEKASITEPITGEGKYGTWYLAKGIKYGDKFVDAFMSKKQLDDYTNLPLGFFTIERIPSEIDFKINGKMVKKLVNEYIFTHIDKSTSEKPQLELTEAQKLGIINDLKIGDITPQDTITIGVNKVVVKDVFPDYQNYMSE